MCDASRLSMVASPVNPANKDRADTSRTNGKRHFATKMLQLASQTLRVGRQVGKGSPIPLMLFNGIGGNIELLEPIAGWMPEREVITFDIPGAGHSPLPNHPYRLTGIARLA